LEHHRQELLRIVELIASSEQSSYVVHTLKRHVSCLNTLPHLQIQGEKRDTAMRFATRSEIEYLDAADGQSETDASMIDEMTRQLEALRHLDQYVCKADWQPRHHRGTGTHKGEIATF
jgi:hypothetical protein